MQFSYFYIEFISFTAAASPDSILSIFVADISYINLSINLWRVLLLFLGPHQWQPQILCPGLKFLTLYSWPTIYFLSNSKSLSLGANVPTVAKENRIYVKNILCLSCIAAQHLKPCHFEVSNGPLGDTMRGVLAVKAGEDLREEECFEAVYGGPLERQKRHIHIAIFLVWNNSFTEP